MNDAPRIPTAPRGRNITLADIARLVGVSTATVSLSLRDSPSVARETRERVKEAAQSIGYIYNRTAASMRTARSGIIGLSANSFTNSFMAEFLEQIEARVEQYKIGILIGSAHENVSTQSTYLGRFLQFKVDGVVVSPASGTTAADLDRFIQTGLPMVQAIREVEGVDLDFVGGDNTAATREALKHLFDLGHRRIACVGGRGVGSTGLARIATYKSFAKEFGLPQPEGFWQKGDMTFEFGVLAGRILLELDDPPTAILCFNDSLAFGVATSLREAGLAIGPDMSLVAFDDTPEARLFYPPLTAIASGQGTIGARAIEMLFERIGNPALPARRVVIMPRLIVRASTAPPRAR